MGGSESPGAGLEVDSLTLLPIYSASRQQLLLEGPLEDPVSPCLPYCDRPCPLERQAKISHSSIRVFFIRCLATATRKLTNTYGQEVASNQHKPLGLTTEHIKHLCVTCQTEYVILFNLLTVPRGSIIQMGNWGLGKKNALYKVKSQRMSQLSVHESTTYTCCILFPSLSTTQYTNVSSKSTGHF